MNDVGSTCRVAVLDMQPIDPPVGGGRLRLLGLYHGLGLPTTYVGSYDWPGERYRHHSLSPTLTEIDVPLSPAHFAACGDWQARVGGKTIIDVTFPQLALHSPEYVAAARNAVAEADILVFSHPWVWPLVASTLGGRSQLVVYDSHNVEGLLRATLLDDQAFGTELVRAVVELEYRLCHAADLVLVCSHEDAELFHRLYGVGFDKLLVVPNGTFTKAIRQQPGARASFKRALALADQRLAIFIGSAYEPNLEAAEFICRTLAPALSDVTFAICGGVAEASSAILAACPPNVRLAGQLTEVDKKAYLSAADLAINPMFSGSGTNIKMFDFMAAGLPIVSTPTGARGLSEGPDKAFLVCEAGQFVQTIRRILANGRLAAALGRAARQRVEEKYSWARISPQLGRLLVRRCQYLQAATPFFSVIIPTYQRHHLLPKLVDGLRAQSFRDFEVILVDQSEEPWSNAGAYTDMNIVYVHTDIKGAVKARNAAAFLACGRVLAFTDDDCRATPDWLRNARAALDVPGVIGIEGLITSDACDDPEYRLVSNQGFEGIGFMTANLFLRREVFVAVDGFDERFDDPHFREDTDLGWRALAHGQIPFRRDVAVFHPPHSRKLVRESFEARVRFFEKDALLLKKHPSKYRQLFIQEDHWRRTPGFWEHFLRGAEKYGVAVPEYYLSQHRAVAKGEP